MICSRCGYNNKETSRFCIKCGSKLPEPISAVNPITGNLQVGSLLQGRYKIAKQIGKGGMGVVYLASDNRFSSRVCVVKEMIENLADDSDEEKQKALLRFNQEADLLAEINHANVPQVYDRFSERNQHYLVMEFVAGVNLKNLLDEYMKSYGAPLPEEDVVIFFIQLCLTLKYLHGHRPTILHRDIKPPNILLTKEGKIKLVDFGIAKTIQTQSQGTSIGTQGYAAPEQYKGLADERTDIYALGATIHHLLTGRDPQMQAPFDHPPVSEFNKNITEDLSHIIDWMLQMSIEARPRSMDAVINAIKASYPDIEERISNYSLEGSKILDIVNETLEVNSSLLAKNRCSVCGHNNNADSRFCKKCGNLLTAGSNSEAVSVGFSGKMIVQNNSRILSSYPNDYSENINVPDKNGSMRLNVILERYVLDGAEYVYITERKPSIVGEEVLAYNVVRNVHGAMQFMKPVTDQLIKSKILDYWRNIS